MVRKRKEWDLLDDRSTVERSPGVQVKQQHQRGQQDRLRLGTQGQNEEPQGRQEEADVLLRFDVLEMAQQRREAKPQVKTAAACRDPRDRFDVHRVNRKQRRHDGGDFDALRKPVRKGEDESNVCDVDEHIEEV